MTNTEPHITKPTRPQLDYLGDLAEKAGESFAWPQTFDQASAEIKRLLAASRASRADRKPQDSPAARGLRNRAGDAAAVRLDELSGYGAGISWR